MLWIQPSGPSLLGPTISEAVDVAEHVVCGHRGSWRHMLGTRRPLWGPGRGQASILKVLEQLREQESFQAKTSIFLGPLLPARGW